VYITMPSRRVTQGTSPGTTMSGVPALDPLLTAWWDDAFHPKISGHVAVVFEGVGCGDVHGAEFGAVAAEELDLVGEGFGFQPAPALLAESDAGLEGRDQVGLLRERLLDVVRLVFLAANQRAGDVLGFGDVSDQLAEAAHAIGRTKCVML